MDSGRQGQVGSRLRNVNYGQTVQAGLLPCATCQHMAQLPLVAMAARWLGLSEGEVIVRAAPAAVAAWGNRGRLWAAVAGWEHDI